MVTLFYNPLVIVMLALCSWALGRCFLSIKMGNRVSIAAIASSKIGLMYYILFGLALGFLNQWPHLAYFLNMAMIFFLCFFLEQNKTDFIITYQQMVVAIALAVIIYFVTTLFAPLYAGIKVLFGVPLMTFIYYLVAKLGGNILSQQERREATKIFAIACVILELDLISVFVIVSCVLLILQALISKAFYDKSKISLFSCNTFSLIWCIIHPGIKYPILYLLGVN